MLITISYIRSLIFFCSISDWPFLFIVYINILAFIYENAYIIYCISSVTDRYVLIDSFFCPENNLLHFLLPLILFVAKFFSLSYIFYYVIKQLEDLHHFDLWFLRLVLSLTKKFIFNFINYLVWVFICEN